MCFHSELLRFFICKLGGFIPVKSGKGHWRRAKCISVATVVFNSRKCGVDSCETNPLWNPSGSSCPTVFSAVSQVVL